MMSQQTALIYCRVSSKRQAREQYGLESQEKMCTERCQKQGIPILKIIRDEGVSGASFERQGMDTLFEVCEKQSKFLQKQKKGKNSANFHFPPQRITHFVCVDGSRLSRNDNLAETLLITQKIRHAGMRLQYVLYPVDIDSSAGMLQENILYAFSAFERRNTRIKSLEGKKARFQEGYRPFGPVPLGYTQFRDKKNVIPQIDPHKSFFIQEALEMYAQGILADPAAVHQYLTQKGFQASSTGTCHPNTVAALFKPEKLYFYAGYFYRPAWNMNSPFPAKHQGIIRLETVEKILNRIQNSNLLGKHHPTHNPDFPLKDFLHCGHCQRKMTGYWSKGRNAKYPYYGCANKKDPERFQVRRQALKTEFQDFLRQMTIPEPVWEVFSLVLQSLWEQRLEVQKLRNSQEEAKIEILQKKMDKIQHLMIQSENPSLIQNLEKEWNQYQMEKAQKESDMEDSQKLPLKSLSDLL